MIGLTRSHCPMWYAFRVVDTVYWTSTYVCVYAVDCSAPRVCWLGEEKEVCVYKRMDWQNIGCHGEVRYTTPNHCNNTFPWNFSDSSISCTFTSIWNINKKKATGEYTSGACNGDNAKTGGPAFFISKIVSFFSFLRNENRILLFHTQNSVYVEWMFYRALLLFL